MLKIQINELRCDVRWAFVFCFMMSDTYLPLYHSLQKALSHSSCASSTWLEKPIIDKAWLQLDANTGCWVDDKVKEASIAFPATFNLKGVHNHLSLGIIEGKHELVSSFF